MQDVDAVLADVGRLERAQLAETQSAVERAVPWLVIVFDAAGATAATNTDRAAERSPT